MRRTRFLHLAYRTFLQPVALLALLTACSIFDVVETTPAYVEVGSFSLTDSTGRFQWTDVEITEVWAFMDGKFVGTFGLPARFPIPVTEDDERQLQLYPGVHADRIEQERVQYPFYDPDSTLRGLRPKQTYKFPIAHSKIARQTKEPRFREDFEGTTISVSADLSDVIPFEKARYSEDPSIKAPPQSGTYYGVSKFHGNPNGEVLRIFQTDPIDIPRPTLPLYLEYWYRSSRYMLVGVYATKPGTANAQLYQQLILSPSPTWKKVYVYLYEELSEAAVVTQASVGNPYAYEKFQVIFTSDSAYNASDFIAVDNIRLMEYK